MGGYSVTAKVKVYYFEIEEIAISTMYSSPNTVQYTSLEISSLFEQ